AVMIVPELAELLSLPAAHEPRRRAVGELLGDLRERGAEGAHAFEQRARRLRVRHFGTLVRSMSATQMSHRPSMPWTQSTSSTTSPEYQLVIRRLSSSIATPEYAVSPALGMSPTSFASSAPPSRLPVISKSEVRFLFVGWRWRRARTNIRSFQRNDTGPSRR